jgi:prophage endopeptidase
LIGLLVWRIDSVTSSRDALQASLEESTANASRLALTLQAQRDKAGELAELDRLHTEKLTNALSENNRLAADIADGRRRLLIKAACPGATRTNSTTSATGVDDAGAAELDAAARQDYYALRRQVTLTESALAGLQGYVREVCK